MVAVHESKYVVVAEPPEIEPKSTVSTVLSAALGEPLWTRERNAFPAPVPTLDTSIRTVCVSGARTRPGPSSIEPAPSNFIPVT